MADSIGDINPDDLIIPDSPQTALAFRTWRLSDSGKLLSINAPNLTGSAGGSKNQQVRKISWIHRQLADDEGQSGWPIGKPLVAHCGAGLGGTTGGLPPEKRPDHGPIPAKKCSCGIYATTNINVIDQYLGNEVIMGSVAIRGPVLGIVELGGRVIPATQGYRAAYARVAAILLIDSAFSLSHAQLRRIAETYQVPALKDHSLDPEDYRAELVVMPPVANPSSVGDEMEAWLASQSEEEGGDD
jgi:hypothetical protein